MVKELLLRGGVTVAEYARLIAAVGAAAGLGAFSLSTAMAGEAKPSEASRQGKPRAEAPSEPRD